jgi:orotate phosphoribosyltransferase
MSRELVKELRTEFIRFALDAEVLRFGEFKTKAGRISPYFFNAGLFNTGSRLSVFGEFFAKTLMDAERAGRVHYDMLFGPAYKGITLASATAISLARRERDVPFAFNRKEAKDHGEGGTLVGAPLKGRVVIIDDVISAGTSIRESVEIIREHGAEPAAVLIALDRRERGGDAQKISRYSAVQEVEREFHIPVISIAALEDLLEFLDSGSEQATALHDYRSKIAEYRARYGVIAD